jgi:Glycosyl transferases group 1/Glycosyltransferase Family 4
MRLLHIDTGREMRGGQWQVLYLLERLAAAGDRVTLLARRGSPLYSKAREEALEVLPADVLTLPGLSREADLVHVHDARAHTLAAVAALRPVVVSRRVAFPVKTHLLSRWKYGRARCYIAVSQYVKARLVEAGIDEERVTVVYDGVPLGPAAVPAAGGIVVAPATDDPRKGTALVRSAAAQAGIDVHFSSDLGRDLSRAAAFVHISEEEGLGSGVLLAMAAGVPVIASRVGGLVEAVIHGETGLLVENTPAAVAAALATLRDDPEAARRMGAAGRRRAQECFSTERMVEQTLRVYDRVLSC